jgi:flagellar FliL protein
MAIVDDTAPPKKETSLLIQIALLLGLTVVAVGIGWGSGMYLNSQDAPAETPGAHGEPAAVEVDLANEHEALGVVYLEPITTNLAGPTATWARLEVALIFDGQPDLLLAQMIHQDILAYMRTVKIHQVEGASGFQHLKSDLEERAALRSGGAVKSILVRTLLFE